MKNLLVVATIVGMVLTFSVAFGGSDKNLG